MSIIKLNFKWNGKKFDDVDVDLSQPVLVLKTQLFSLTGVEPDRQKIMIKGGLLKDDMDLNTLNFKSGQSLMMMGSASKIPVASDQKVVFLEDLTQDQVAKALEQPAGLVNLGNTCYMNATIQCLRVIPELDLALSYLKQPSSPSNDYNLSAGIRSLLKDLRDSGSAITPVLFLTVLRSAFSQFAQQERQGIYSQQDAEECWSQIISALHQTVPGLNKDGEVDGETKFVQQFMTGELITTMKCDEAPEEEPTTGIESFEKLRVNIGSGISTYMVADLATAFTEEIEKNSPTLGKSAKYIKTSKISRLPEYIACNFIRFQWKISEGVRAKILKKVVFPHDLDMTPFCVPELQEKISPAKLKLKELEEQLAIEKKRKSSNKDNNELFNNKKDNTQDNKKEFTAEKMKSAVLEQVELLKDAGVDESIIYDVGNNPTGQYELVAVLTHVGRSADSGHYIGWAKHGKDERGEDQWWKFDDDKVSQVSADDITKLQGGGDWHSAYICIYKAKKLFKI